MRVLRPLTEDYDISKARIGHLADLVLTDGSQGAQRALGVLQQVVAKPQSVSIKPDGRVAIAWGRDEKGFILGDKHMPTKGIMAHSPDELRNVILARKGDSKEQYLQFLLRMWPIFEASVPKNFKGFVIGDLMYDKKLTPTNGQFKFKPLTVEYSVPVASAMGKQIAASQAGVVVHSYFPQQGAIGHHIDGPHGLISGNLAILSDAMPKFKVSPPKELTKVQSLISKNGAAIDQLLDLGTLRANKLSDFSALLTKYINAGVKKRSWDNLVGNFLPWCATNGVSAPKQANLTVYIGKNKKAFTALFELFLSLSQANDQVVAELDHAANQGDLRATVGGDMGQEGFIVHSSEGPVKLINRFKFSATHFLGEARVVQPKEKSTHANFAFGRMNPPHYGHAGLIKVLSSQPGDWFLFLSKTHEPKKNPLSYVDKIKWVKTLFPEVKGHLIEDPTIRTYLDAATWLYDQGYKTVTFVAGEDDMVKMKVPLEAYNGKEMRNGFYQFDKIEFVVSPRLTSATNARTAAAEGKEKEFWKATKVDPNLTVGKLNLYQATQKGLITTK